MVCGFFVFVRFSPGMEQELTEAEICRSDLIAYCIAQYPKFVYPRHIKLIAEHLERVERGEIVRLMIFAPPRHGKSELVSKLFPCWYMGRNPDKTVAVATYGQTLSNKIGLSLNQRMNSEVFQEIFPDCRPINESNSITNTVTTKGGGFMATSVGGGLTGTGGHLRILDDPNKNRQDANSETIQETQWDWWTSVFATRGEQDIKGDDEETAQEDKSPIVVILTRWSDKDIAKRLLDQQEANGGKGAQWVVLNLEAICESEDDPLGRPVVPDPTNSDTWEDKHALWPQKYSARILASICLEQGWADWNALFQQRPSSASGDLFLREGWKRYKELPDGCERPVMSWDMSYKDKKKSDFVVGLVAVKHGANVYIIDRIKGRMNYPATEKKFIEACLKYPKATAKWVELKANGQPIVDSLSSVISGIIGVDPESLGSKDTRWQAAARYQQAGNIFLPEGETWVDNFIEECAAVPNGRYDDDADAFAMLMLMLLGQPSNDALLKLYEREVKALPNYISLMAGTGNADDPYAMIYGKVQ